MTSKRKGSKPVKVAKEERRDVRTTVSLADVIWKMARTRMIERGFNDNFSAYVADLIRTDAESDVKLSQIKAALERLEDRRGA